MQRLSLFIIPALVAMCLFIVISNTERIANPPPQPPPQDVTAPRFDIHSAGIDTVIFNAEGGIDYTLQAVSQTRFSGDGDEEEGGEVPFVLLQQPVIKVYRGVASHWNIAARSGRIPQTERRVGILEMHDEVEITHDEMRVNGDSARLEYDEADSMKRRMVVLGSPVRYRREATAGGGRQASGSGDMLELYGDPDGVETLMRLTGNAVLRSPDTNLNCAALIYTVDTGLLREAVGPCTAVLSGNGP